MGASLHVSLPDEMRRYVDRIADGSASYATPSEYVRDLIRKDMDRLGVQLKLLRGSDEADRGEFLPDDFMDKLDQDFKPVDA